MENIPWSLAPFKSGSDHSATPLTEPSLNIIIIYSDKIPTPDKLTGDRQPHFRQAGEGSLGGIIFCSPADSTFGLSPSSRAASGQEWSLNEHLKMYIYDLRFTELGSISFLPPSKVLWNHAPVGLPPWPRFCCFRSPENRSGTKTEICSATPDSGRKEVLMAPKILKFPTGGLQKDGGFPGGSRFSPDKK